MISNAEELFKYNKNRLLESPLFYQDETDEELIKDIKISKIVIYTAFTGDYDSLKEPEYIDDNCDYICFTDNPNIKSDIWKIMPMEDSNLDNNRKAKQYRLLPHKYLPEYKYSFWIDSSFKIIGSIREYVYKYLKNSMLNVLHDERNCIYDEFTISAAMIRYPTAILENQIEKYRNENMPKHYGLVSSGFMFREHNNPKIIKLMEDWWEEILEFTNQDQISFSYVCWKNDFNPSVADIFTWNNEYWTKGEQYHHNYVISSSLSCDNLINNIESKKTYLEDLSPSEIQLLYNDLITLKNEKQYPFKYLESQMHVYQNERTYTLKKYYQHKGKNTICFDLEYFDNIDHLRFFPTIKKYAFCCISSVNTDAEDYKIVNVSSINKFDGVQIFGKDLPHYIIKGNLNNATYMEITFDLKIINEFEYELASSNYKLKKNIQSKDMEIEEQTENIKKLNKEIVKNKKTIKKKDEEIKEQKQLIEDMINSHSWKITTPLRLFANIFKK